jgi:membrane protein
MAAAIAYWAIVSVFPVILLLLGLFGLALQGSALQDRVIDEVLAALPFSEEQGRKVVTDAVQSISGPRGGAFGVVGLLVAAWSGSNLFGAIRRALNLIFQSARKRPAVQEKLLDLAMVVGLAPFFLSSLGATALLRIARQTSEGLPILGEAAREWGIGWDVISLFVPMVISFTAFAILYSLAPAKRLSFRAVWPGAFAAAALFELSKLGFSLYLEHFAMHEVVYGSLGVIVTFFIWSYVSSTILLFGAEVVCEYPNVATWQRDTNANTVDASPSFKQRLSRLFRSFGARLRRL